MKGYAAVSASRDLFDEWDAYGAEVRATAEAVAANLGGRLTEVEPTFSTSLDDPSVVTIRYEMVK